MPAFSTCGGVMPAFSTCGGVMLCYVMTKHFNMMID